MKIISFHLKGKMGHFRRFYSNSSALTYSIPPRTTICGIIAGILGMERDSYYELFSLDQCGIAVALRSPIKKTFYKLNLLMVKNDNDLNGSQEFYSQTATEMLLPSNIRTDDIDYQVWFYHKDKTLMKQLDDVLKEKAYGYGSLFMPVSLGTAYNLGWLEYEGEVDGQEYSDEAAVLFDSVVPVNLLQELCLENITDKGIRLIREELPMEFDKERRLTLKGIGDVLINLTNQQIKASVSTYVKIGESINIAWLC